MHYETPSTKTLSWRKTWFYLPDDVQHVMIADIETTTDAPVFSVLDQRRHSGQILVDGENVITGNFSGVQTLFHGGIGYAFNESNFNTYLSIQSGNRTGSFSDIGSPVQQAPETVDLFSAWLVHEDTSVPVEYTVYPATKPSTFLNKMENTRIITIQNDGSISAVVDEKRNIAMFIFWEAAGGNATVPSRNKEVAPINVASSSTAALIVDLDRYNLTVADPTQMLASVRLTFALESGMAPTGWRSNGSTADITVQLPSDGLVGSSVTASLF